VSSVCLSRGDAADDHGFDKISHLVQLQRQHGTDSRDVSLCLAANNLDALINRDKRLASQRPPDHFNDF
jgi:hypothetical protein